MGDNRLKMLERWQILFLSLGIVGLIDIATKSLVGLGDIGGVSYVLGLFVANMLGPQVGAAVMAVLWPVFGFAIIWLIVAWGIGRKRKKLITKSDATEK